jgi:uncharacterized DUF497 family protein
VPFYLVQAVGAVESLLSSCPASPPRRFAVDICIGERLYDKMRVATAEFDWDSGKRDKCCKHGLSVAEMEHVVRHSETLIVPDVRNSEYEPRFIAIGRTPAGRYAFVAFTPREIEGRAMLRPISARYMHKKEIAKYEKEISGAQNR